MDKTVYPHGVLLVTQGHGAGVECLKITVWPSEHAERVNLQRPSQAAHCAPQEAQPAELREFSLTTSAQPGFPDLLL